MESPRDPVGTTSPRRWWQRRWLQAVAVILVVCAAGATLFIRHVEHNAEPIVRQRIIDTMSKRFNAPVELDGLEISAFKGLEVIGTGLRVARTSDPADPAPLSGPILTVQRFEFRTDVRSLFHASSSVGVVYVQGMVLHIPPAERRGPLLHRAGDSSDPNSQPLKLSIIVNHVICDDAKLFIDTLKPGKDPLEFNIQHLDLTGLGVQKAAFHYDATLTNPKPQGLIHAVGSFGPWQSDAPRSTPIDGNYDFSHADLNTIKGIAGILSSTGHFSGPLERISVDGSTDTPNFSLDTSNHPLPLHTDFHAIVDGTTGDTTLDPVRARLLHSEFICRGTVVKVPRRGHDIALDVDMPGARMEDMLQLAVKTSPPLMRGALTMHTRLHIPPGPVRVPQKLELAGHFEIHHVSFSNPSVQDKIDGMSLRAQGRPREVGIASSNHEAEVVSDMKANFSVGHGITTVHDLNYQIPGALVLLNGVYSLNGDLFEFKGHVRTDATASQMTTGWKSFLLKAVDPFLKKNGAGLELPVSISGTRGDVHFGLAMHGSADQSTEQMQQDLKLRAQAQRGAAHEKAHQAALAKQQHDQYLRNVREYQREFPRPAGKKPLR